MDPRRSGSMAILFGAALFLTGPDRSLADQARVYRYAFAPGETLRYRVVVRSRASMDMTHGPVPGLGMESTSIVSYRLTRAGNEAPSSRDGTVLELETRTLRARATLDGQERPPPAGALEPGTLTIRSTGEVVDGRSGSFPLVFPEKPLAPGESWTVPQAGGEEAGGLPLEVRFTLADVEARIPEYDRPAHLFEAEYLLGPGAAGRDVRLSQGEGSFWFDPEDGRILKGSMKIAYEETATVDLGGGESETSKRSVAFGMSMSLVPPKETGGGGED